jgi:hypothetical protein
VYTERFVISRGVFDSIGYTAEDMVFSTEEEDKDAYLERLVELAVDGLGANDSVRITPDVLPNAEVDTDIVCIDHIRLTPRYLLLKGKSND